MESILAGSMISKMTRRRRHKASPQAGRSTWQALVVGRIRCWGASASRERLLATARLGLPAPCHSGLPLVGVIENGGGLQRRASRAYDTANRAL